jgi:hypothetical protein
MLDHVVAAWAGPIAPKGDAIRRWIARHPDIKGVGDGYAERLWDAHGPRLYDILRQRDVGALATVLDLPKACAIVEAFGLLLDEIAALEDLDGLGLDGRTAYAAVRLFGADAGRLFREDPYRLTLLEPWSKVDLAALASGLEPSDPRRLVAAVDVAAARAFRTTEMTRGDLGNVLLGHYSPQGAGERVRGGADPGRSLPVAGSGDDLYGCDASQTRCRADRGPDTDCPSHFGAIPRMGQAAGARRRSRRRGCRRFGVMVGTLSPEPFGPLASLAQDVGPQPQHHILQPLQTDPAMSIGTQMGPQRSGLCR